MKKLAIIFLNFIIPIISYAQVVLSVDVSSSGGLSTAIGISGITRSTITDLTVTGTIDARDFMIMSGNNMPFLTNLDLSGANIVGYTGTGGPKGSNQSYDYLANSIGISFYSAVTGTSQLKSIKLPNTLTSIENSAFRNCSNLTNITIPQNLISIGNASFQFCESLTSISIPSKVNFIGLGAFESCGAFINIDTNNLYYSSIDGVLFNKNKTVLIACPTSKTGVYTVPSTVDTIGQLSLMNCKKISSVLIPSSVIYIGELAFETCTSLRTISFSNSVKYIGKMAFYNSGLSSISIPNSIDTLREGTFEGCSYLKTVYIPLSLKYIDARAFTSCKQIQSFYSYSSIPIKTSSMDVLDQSIMKTNGGSSTIYVPKGCKGIYQNSSWWSSLNIVEMDCSLSINNITLSNINSSSSLILLTSNVEWSALSNKTWLTVSPNSGSGNETLIITALENKDTIDRTAIITISTIGGGTKTINIVQSAFKAIGTDFKDSELDNLNIYPNPANYSFAIQSQISANINIYSMTGKLVLNSHVLGNELIPINNLSNGIYFVEIKINNNIINRKLVVNKK